MATAMIPVSSWVLSTLLLLGLTSLTGCASRQHAHEKLLRECSTSGDAHRRVQRHGSVSPYGDLSSGANDEKLEVTEVRDDCVYTVKVRVGQRSWEISGLSWVGKYTATEKQDRVAFTIADREGWHVIVDGVVGPAFDGTLSDARFSRDGQHVLYVGYVEGRNGQVMVDGKDVAHAPFGIDHGACDFTSDGRYLVAIRNEEGSLQVNAGGALGPPLDTDAKGPEVRASSTNLQLATSWSGGRYAYVGTRGGRGVLVVDGHEIPSPKGRFPQHPLFSASGARMLYRAISATGADEKTWPSAVVIDGVVHLIPGVTSAEFIRGELPLVRTSVLFGIGSYTSSTLLFGVDRLDQKKPEGEPDDRIILDDRSIDPQDLDVLVDGTVTLRGHPFAHVRGKRGPTLAR